MPSGPGWFCARVSTMNCWWGSVTSSPVPALPSGPRVTSGSSLCSGTKTALPLLTVWSTPWSKNCPKNVNSELYGGDRPTSVVTFGMNSVLCDGTQFAGAACTGGTASGSGSVVHGNRPGLPWVRTGNSAAATAAGLVDVWSTIRLLIVRGCESTTLPLPLYVGSAGGKPGGEASPSRNTGSVSRGNTSSAAANLPRSA